MAKTLQQFINEATRTTKTGNTLSTVEGGKANLPRLGDLQPGQSPFNYTPKAPKNGNAVPGKAAAPGTKLSDYTPPIVKATTAKPPQSIMGKVKELAGKALGKGPQGWQQKTIDAVMKVPGVKPAAFATIPYATWQGHKEQEKELRDQGFEDEKLIKAKAYAGDIGDIAGFAAGAATFGAAGTAVAGPVLGGLPAGMAAGSALGKVGRKYASENPTLVKAASKAVPALDWLEKQREQQKQQVQQTRDVLTSLKKRK